MSDLLLAGVRSKSELRKVQVVTARRPTYHSPVEAMLAQGSWISSASPFCKSSTLI